MRRLSLLLVLCSGFSAQAWSTRACSTNSSLQPSYPGGAVWPFVYLSNMPSGSSGRVGVSNAMSSWNSIVGAYDNLSAPTGGFGFCTKPDNAGVSVIGWDDGTCHAWGPSEVGVTVVWTQSCSIVKEAVYFNTAFPFSTVDFESTALHELGHYQNAAHDWYELSIMGYSDTSFTYLTAADHSFLRGVWGSGNSALPDLYLNRIVARSPIVPDQQSMVQSAPPTCSGSCADLQPGDTIRVQLSYGNAGSTAAGTFQLEMRLGTRVIGTWTQPSYPAHAQDTYWFSATVPAGVPPGSYSLSVEIDPSGAVTQANGPTSGEVVTFSGFAVRTPAGWTCSPARYGALDGCDCECGVADPDCSATTPVARGCGDANTCTDDRCDTAGHCLYPANVATCEDGLYCTTGDRCAAGSCAAGVARDCSAQSNACNLGVCNEAQRACLRSPRNEGGTCDDGLFCTVSDTCASGTCSGSARDCSALSSVCAAGTCSESQDLCVATPINQGQSCDDGLRCTTGDSCRSGTCAGTALDCSSLNTSCTRGECDPTTGACISVPLANGTACSDGLYCTVGESCTAGACGGGQPRGCSQLDSTCSVGVCDEAGGACRASARNEGAACSDGRYCTENDACVAGVCTGSAKDCSSLDGTCTRGTCDDATRRCVAAAANEGQGCDDGAFCTTGDRCSAGACVGARRDCSQLTTSCSLGVCDEAARACASQPQREGQSCEDGQPCTIGEFCRGGTCQPSLAKDCSALSSACAVGTCDPVTGACSAVPSRDGTVCDDHQSCTVNDACTQGVCAGRTLDCSQLNDACHYGKCDEQTGQCAVFGQVGPCEGSPSGCGCGVSPLSSVLFAGLVLLLRSRRRYC